MNLLLLLLFPFLVGCQLFDQPEIAPSYIHIENFNFIITNSNQGTNSEKITDAWVYIDDTPAGVYELPANFPVLEEGKHKVRIRAGIKENGISGTRVPYPFYASFIIEELIFDKTTTIIGLIIIIIPVLTDDVRLKPWKKNNWLIAIPNKPHIAINKRSFVATRSLINNTLKTQNKIVAPKTLKKIKTLGVK